MSDLIHKAQRAKIRVRDLSLPKWQRLCQGLQAFSGLELSALADGVRQKLEADLVEVNRILARYPPDEEGDCQNIGDADLEKLLDTLDMAAEQVIAAELDRIVADLEEDTSKLLLQALQEARELPRR